MNSDMRVSLFALRKTKALLEQEKVYLEMPTITKGSNSSPLHTSQWRTALQAVLQRARNVSCPISCLHLLINTFSVKHSGGKGQRLDVCIQSIRVLSANSSSQITLRKQIPGPTRPHWLPRNNKVTMNLILGAPVPKHLTTKLCP